MSSFLSAHTAWILYKLSLEQLIFVLKVALVDLSISLLDSPRDAGWPQRLCAYSKYLSEPASLPMRRSAKRVKRVPRHAGHVPIFSEADL